MKGEMTGIGGTSREKAYRIEDDPICGRQLVAARTILAGELIIDEPALLTGPGFVGGASISCSTFGGSAGENDSVVCLVCCKNLSTSSGNFTCPTCNLKLCSELCRENKQHLENECLVFPKISKVWNDSQTRSKKSFYNLILVIRALFYKLRDVQKWDQLQILESKKEALEKVGAFTELEDVFNCLTWDLFASVQNLPHPPESRNENEKIADAAKHCLGVMRINAFSSFSESYSREGLFFLSSLMSHSCVVNTDRQMEVIRVFNERSCAAADSDFLSGSRMVVRASVDIQKDEPITTTYLSLLYNTEERQRIMISNWLFTCQCKRCKDPTECKTFSGGILCRCSGSDNDYSNACTCTSSNETSAEIYNVLRSRPRHLSNITDLENWLDKNDTGVLLHPNHSYFAHIKLFLCQYYGRQNGGLSAVSTNQLKRKILYCQQILNIYERIFPGIQMCRGVVLFELWCALEKCLELKLLPIQISHSHPFSSATSCNFDTSTVSTTFYEEDVENIKMKAIEILNYALPNSSEEAMANVLRFQ